jgi:AcrR family transcriptional regulator
MPRPAYTSDERDEIEAKIREAALRLFAEDGYRAVSLRAIARALGWSAPALYRYYDSKDALLAAIRAEGFRKMQTILEGARLQARDPEDGIRKAMTAYLRFAMTQTELFRLMYELDQGAIADYPHVFRERRKAFAEAEKIAQAVIDAGAASGDANRLAHLFWVNVHGLATLALANQLDLGQSYKDLVRPIETLVLRNLSDSEGGENV